MEPSSTLWNIISDTDKYPDRKQTKHTHNPQKQQNITQIQKPQKNGNHHHPPCPSFAMESTVLIGFEAKFVVTLT